MVSKNMSILDFVDKGSESVIPEREMGMGDVIIAIGKGLWYKYRNTNGSSGYIEFTVPEILRYGGCVEYAVYKHSRDNANCVITVDLAKYAYNVLNTLHRHGYLDKNEGIVVTYTVNERSELWKILSRVKSPVDMVQFIREVVKNA